MPRRVVVVDYDPAWAAQFETLREPIARVLGRLAVSIEHIGSTSVPGLAAKPVIDIDVVIEDRSVLPEVIDRLAQLGYLHEGDRGIEGREGFDGDAIDAPRHHLYVCARDNLELRRHLGLRDWLGAHLEDRSAYAQLKRQLAARYPTNAAAYCEAKTEFIEAILARAPALGPQLLETDQLQLRPLSMAHREGYARLLADPAVHPFILEHGPEPATAIPERIAAKQRQWSAGSGATWAVLLDDEFIGYTSVHGLGPPRVAISYAISPPRQRRGYGTQAVRATLEWLAERGTEEVEARTHLSNDASARLLLELGFEELEPSPDPPRRVFEHKTTTG